MRHWTNEENEILKSGYQEIFLNLSLLSSRIKRSKADVCEQAKKFNLTRIGRPRKAFDIKFLLEHYKEYTDQELAEKLGLSIHAVMYQRQKMRLMRDDKFIKKQHSEGVKKAWQNPASKFNGSKFKQFLSNRMMKQQACGKLNKGNKQYKSGKREDLGIYVRSGWEANYARYLNWMKNRGDILAWSYEPDRFEFPVKRGTRSYTPDFKVIEKNGDIDYHEVKGWLTPKGKTRLKRMKKYHPNIKIILITGKEYYAISKWKSLIPGWES